MNYRENVITSNIENLISSSGISFDNKLVFNFEHFALKSIVIDDFNNFYANVNEAKHAVKDFFDTLKTICSFDIKTFYSPHIKKQFHFNLLNDKLIVKRIKHILIDGYGFPDKLLLEMENSFCEFSFSNGKRVIGYLINNNTFGVLFIDNNHLVCIDSSRNVKTKMLFNYPSLFGSYVDNGVSIDVDEIIKMMFDDAKNGYYGTLDEFIRAYEDLGVLTLI